MLKLNVGRMLMLSLVLIQAGSPVVAQAKDVFERCGDLENKVRSEIELESAKQFKPMKYQARNAAILEAIVKAGKADKAVAAALTAIRGKPKLDNETRLKYNDLIVTFMHEKKLSTPKALVTCPANYLLDESQLSTGVWQPDSTQPGYSRQGLSDSANMPKACKKDDAFSLPEESTSISSGLNYSSGLDHIEKDPTLVAITNVDRPVTIKFRGKNLVLSNLSVLTYMHLKNGSIEETTGNLYLHGRSAKFDGRDIELESFIDNEILPAECKDFHNIGPRTEGGSTTGGIIEQKEATIQDASATGASAI